MYKIAVIEIKSATGVETFTNEFIENFKKYSINGELEVIDLNNCTRKKLKTFDLIYFPTLNYDIIKKIYKLVFIKSKKVLTVHGWVTSESLQAFKEERRFFKKIIKLVNPLAHWILINFGFFDITTSPTLNTAEVNGYKNTKVIPNGINSKAVKFDREINVSKLKLSDINLVSYSSIGGGKDLSVLNLIKSLQSFLDSNSSYKSKIKLHVFGKKPKRIDDESFVELYGKVSRELFVESFRYMDLFITWKTFPDLGYAELEAGLNEVPIMKLYTNKNEELVSGKTAIIIDSETDFQDELLKFLDEDVSIKKQLGINLKKYICDNYFWDKVILKWEKLFEEIILKR